MESNQLSEHNTILVLGEYKIWRHTMKIDESILNSVKKMLGLSTEYDYFDQDIIMHINTTFMVLTQLGIGPVNGFYIQDESATWDEFLGNEKNLEAVKTYIYLKVKLMFDPPLSNTVMECMKQNISELEWRLNHQTESN